MFMCDVCMYVRMYVCMCLQRPEEGTGSLEQEMQMVESSDVRAKKQTWILCQKQQVLFAPPVFVLFIYLFIHSFLRQGFSM